MAMIVDRQKTMMRLPVCERWLVAVTLAHQSHWSSVATRQLGRINGERDRRDHLDEMGWDWNC